MFQLTILAGLLSVALASPQWYPQPAYHGAHAGYAHGAAAPLGPDGRVVDTPEVAASKAAHLAALAEASARAPHGPADHHDGAYHDGWNAPNPAYAPAHLGPRYHGPPAPLGPDGRVVDTPEVQAAKAHHFALFNAAAHSAPAGPAHAAPAYPAHADYDSGAYNPAWDSPAWNHY
ncbi:GSCOCG00002318001-RA-CDS [Cotesia congregata]|uniref:pupal cuticle protein-like isoform X1 n=1 Tax=Cotesia glomerata TaxID=32391 RepID=UPI001763B98C|nr:pupal cuticle protein-like isoform X1 [Cotesia glomerata]CAD6237447.1 GSCOCG00002318001-RA-CDS [Cotesia congregata]